MSPWLRFRSYEIVVLVFYDDCRADESARIKFSAKLARRSIRFCHHGRSGLRLRFSHLSQPVAQLIERVQLKQQAGQLFELLISQFVQA